MKKELKFSAYDEYLSVVKSITHSFISLFLFVLPLVITNAYYDITETKLFAFYILSGLYIVIQLFLFLFFSISKKRDFLKSLNFKINFVDVAFILFGLSYIISAALSDFGSKDVVFGIGSRYQGVLTILLYVVVYFILTRTFSFSPKCIMWAGIGFSVVCIIAVLNGFSIDPLGIYLELSGDNKEHYVSTIGNINFYSAYCNILLPSIVVGYCKATDVKTSVVFGAFVVCGALGIPFTASESFLLGFLVAMLLLFSFFMTDKKALKRFIGTCCLFLLTMVSYTKLYNSGLIMDTLHFEPSALMNLISNPIIVGVLVIAFVFVFVVACKKPNLLHKIKKVYSVLLVIFFVLGLVGIILINSALKEVDLGEFNRYLKFSDNWGTWRGRNWAFCIKTFAEAPLVQKLFGFGPETYYHLTDKTSFYISKSLDQAHNEYLHYLISAGLFGLVSYLCILAGTVKKCIGKLNSNSVAMSILCGLVAYWIQAVVNIAQPFTTPIMFLFIAILSKISTINSVEIEK